MKKKTRSKSRRISKPKAHRRVKASPKTLALVRKALKQAKNVKNLLTFKVGAVTDTKNLKAREHGRKGKSIYNPLYAKLNSLKVGKALPIPIPKGVTNENMLKRLAMAITYGIGCGSLTVPKGYRIQRRTMVGGKAVKAELVRKK